MAQCPKCRTKLQEDYGMVTCPGCGAFLFIDMDGVAQSAAPEPPEPAPEKPTPPRVSTFISDDPSGISDFPEFTSPGTPMEEHNPFPSFDANTDPAPDVYKAGVEVGYETPIDTPAPENQPENQPEPPIENADEPPEPEVAFSMDGFFGNDDGAPPSSSSKTETNDIDDPLGLSEFANSEMSQGRDGLLMYRVFIGGIDSKEIRDAVRDSVQDQRFGWDAQRLMTGITKGQLRIDDLSPVKASVLVGRLKRLPLRIRWEQYSITSMNQDPAPTEPDQY